MGFQNLYYAKICIPIAAKSPKEAVAKAQAAVEDARDEFWPTELAGHVISVKSDLELNPNPPAS